MKEKIYDNIVEVDVNDIKAYSGSHKTDDSIEMLKTSIQMFGIQNPIIIDKNNEIVAHNGIYKAAVELGYTSVPCIYVDDLTEEQVKQYRIADNKTGEFATWNEKKLRKEMSYLQSPTELQSFFDENIQSMVGFNGDMFNVARQASPIPAPSAPKAVRQSNIPPVDPEKIKQEQEKLKESQKKFKEEIKNVEKALAAKPANYFEYVCSSCGKKVIVKMDV